MISIKNLTSKSGELSFEIRPGDTIWVNIGDQKRLFDSCSMELHFHSLTEFPFSIKFPIDGNEHGDGWYAKVYDNIDFAIELHLGYDLPVGANTIQLSLDLGGNIIYSDHFPFPVTPWKFQLRSTQFHCINESTEASGSDEVVTAWIHAADERVRAKTSRQYGNVDAGKTYQYDGDEADLMEDLIYRKLVVGVVLSDWDTDENPQNNAGLTSVSSELARLVSNGGAGAALVAVILVLITLGIDLIIDQFEGPDSLGSGNLTFTVSHLIRQTQNDECRYNFYIGVNSSQTTSQYIVDFELRRMI